MLKKSFSLEINLNARGEKVKTIIKQLHVVEGNVWSRRSVILPIHIGSTLYIHDGLNVIKRYITKEMVGAKVGEFAFTRKTKNPFVVNTSK